MTDSPAPAPLTDEERARLAELHAKMRSGDPGIPVKPDISLSDLMLLCREPLPADIEANMEKQIGEKRDVYLAHMRAVLDARD